MSKKILWLSRHSPLDVQLAQLREKYGENVIVEQPRELVWKSAEDIIKIFKEGGYDDMVIVAPLTVIARICEYGIKPLWAEMQVVKDATEADTKCNGRLYKFIRFRRIKCVKLEFEEEEV